MPIENDPASPEDKTATDPQVEAELAESTEQSEEGSETSEDQGKPEEKPEEAVDEVEIGFGGESAKAEEPTPKDDRAWSKARQVERDLRAENAQLKAEAQARSQPPVAADPGPPPTDEDPDVLWDREKLLAKHAKWLKDKEAHETEKAKSATEAEAAKASWADKVATAERAGVELTKRISDYPARLARVAAALRFPGQKFDRFATIFEACDDVNKAPSIIAALDRDPARLKDLVETNNAVRFVAKVSKLEDKVQMKEKPKGTTPPPPEGKPKGTGGSSGAVDHQRERLLDEATKSGNIDKLRAYDKSKRAK